MGHHAIVLPSLSAGRARAALVFGAWLAIGFATTEPASAAGDVALGLRYEADPGCPSAETFLSRVEGADLVLTRRDDWDVAVRLSNGADGSRGRLELRGTSPATARELRGSTCDGVAAALALATTLALAPETATTAEDEAAPPEPMVKSADERPTARPEPEETGLPAITPTAITPPEADTAPRRVATHSDGARWGIGVAGGIVNGPLSRTGALASVFVEATPVPWIAARLHATRILPRDERYDFGTASADVTRGGVELCVSRWAPSAVFRARPCAGANIGVLTASAELRDAGADSRTERGLWADVALGGRLEWTVQPSFELELQARAVAPLHRYEFVVLGPQRPIEEVPSIQGEMLLGAAFKIP